MSLTVVKRAEWSVAILLSLTVITLLIVRTLHAGPLWRDECGMVEIARMPHLADIWQNFRHQTFPPLVALIVRGYIIFFGSKDITLRVFGLLVAIGILAVAWLNSRIVVRDVPLSFLALVGLNETFLVTGTSMRGYGLGCLFFLLTLGLTAKAFFQPSKSTLTLLLVSCIAGIYCLANNVALVGALATAATAVLLLRRRFSAAAIASGLTGIAALSFVPVAQMYFGAHWSVIAQIDTNLAVLFPQFCIALGEPISFTGSLWIALTIATLGAAIWRVAFKWRFAPNREADVVVLLLLFNGLSILSYVAFLKLVSYATQPWYFITFLCAWAGTLDLIAPVVAQTIVFRLARLIVAVAALAVMPFSLRAPILERASNIDLIADALRKQAAPDDFIVVNPWYFGVTFQRYYRGDAPWTTIPPLSDHHLHRYDLVREELQKTDPLAGLWSQMQQTLQSGKRVWIVGTTRRPERGLPQIIQPAPDPRFGWDLRAYTNIWSMQLAAFLQTHVADGSQVSIDAPAINPNEYTLLLVAQGWRD